MPNAPAPTTQIVRFSVIVAGEAIEKKKFKGSATHFKFQTRVFSTMMMEERYENLVELATRQFLGGEMVSSRVSWVVEAKVSQQNTHEWRPSAKGSGERREMVQACRALRMQIKSFEDEFFEAKGHTPRGQERNPLASTYRQYREWKKDIRDHSATQIQAVARCCLARRYLRALLDQQTPTIPSSTSKILPPSDEDNDDDGVEALVREKRRIKQQLKDYDTRFFKTHGRMPHKLEKEPIRALYERYHSVKASIPPKK